MSAAKDLRKRADAAHKRGSKELSDDLHAAARREEASAATMGGPLPTGGGESDCAPLPATANTAIADEPTLFRALKNERKRWREALEAIAKRPCEVFPHSTCNQQRAKRRCNSCIARSALHGTSAATVDWIGPDEREERLIEQFARDMHARTSGDWGAAGWITQQAFRSAAVSAVRELNIAGFDLLDVLPKGAQGRV